MSKYNYYNLRELNSKHEVDFYGVIVDATFPCKEEEDDFNFVCNLKVIDHSVNYLTDPLDIQQQMVYVTIKSDQLQFLPFVTHVGDILRIHRGVYSHKTKRNVYLNLDSKGPCKSAWCIFAGASNFENRSFEALQSSSRHFTFEEVDTHYISAMRNWLRKYIREKGSLVYPKAIRLEERNKELTAEKDLMVHVASKQKNGSDTISLWVQDDTDACELVCYSIYNYVNVGDVIRVRSFKTHQK